MTIQAVVFDIGRVLIHWEPEAFYDAQIGEARREAFFAEVPMHQTNLDIDAGAPWKETVYALAEAHPDWATEIRWWHDRWLEMASPDIPHSARLLRALKAKGVQVFALSNFGVGTFELAARGIPRAEGIRPALCLGLSGVHQTRRGDLRKTRRGVWPERRGPAVCR